MNPFTVSVIKEKSVPFSGTVGLSNKLQTHKKKGEKQTKISSHISVHW